MAMVFRSNRIGWEFVFMIIATMLAGLPAGDVVGQHIDRFDVPQPSRSALSASGFYLHLTDESAKIGRSAEAANGEASAKKSSPANGTATDQAEKSFAQKTNGKSAAKSENDQAEAEKTNGDQDRSTSPRRQSPSTTARRPRFDPQEVERGRAAFESSCTQCHDAERALEKRKSRTGWLATVRRMARMDGADIAEADFGPIATYLASLSQPAATAQPTDEGEAPAEGEGEGAGDEEAARAEEETAEEAMAAEVDAAAAIGGGLNISGTVSTIWRGGNDNLENPDFFPDVWLRADWQPDGPLRGRVTTCTSCHSDQTNGGGFTFELVEATAHYDLMHLIKERDCRPEECKSKIEAEIKAGRFIVPFGAYAAISHPGAYRTVTNPLMYNMGRQVNPMRSRPPVLPMPYSDEGVDLFAKFPLPCDWNITLDFYAVNGLQGAGSGVNYTRTRSYTDNNNDAGVGGRATIGNNQVRLGGSLMAGHLEDDQEDGLDYQLAGADATARFLDNDVRVYFEYAIRRNDTSFSIEQVAYGIVSELEVLLLTDPNISALARYDTLEFRDFFGKESIERVTWGVSTTAFGGSLLMMNHEVWNFPTGEKDVNLLGLRWVATF